MLAHTTRAMLAALVLVSMPLLAEEAAKPATAAPAPPAELAQLAFFVGTWSCTGTGFASDMGPEHATAATVVGAQAVGGAWVHVSYDESKTTVNPSPVHAGVYMGYDSAKKLFVLACVDSFGSYCTQTSAGWNGDTLAFEGTSNVGGKSIGARDTFVKKGADQVTHTGELQGDDKAWVKTDEENCRKGM